MSDRPESVETSASPRGATGRFGGIARLYGAAALPRLSAAHVCVVGVGWLADTGPPPGHGRQGRGRYGMAIGPAQAGERYCHQRAGTRLRPQGTRQRRGLPDTGRGQTGVMGQHPGE